MNDSTALVTGANKGIGKEIARALLAEGCTVHIGSRDAGRGQRAVDELGDGARLLLLGVTDEDSIAAAAAGVERLDILVNNAGISPGGGAPPESTADEFRRTYETNVFGVVAVTNAFLPALRRSAHPRVVNISSGTASRTISPASLTYTSSPTLSSAPNPGSPGMILAFRLVSCWSMPYFTNEPLCP